MTPPDDDETLRSFSAIAPRGVPAANASVATHLAGFPLSAQEQRDRAGGQGKHQGGEGYTPSEPRRRLKDVVELHGLALEDLPPEILGVLQSMDAEIGAAQEALTRAEARIAFLEQERNRDGPTPLLNRRAFLAEIERLKQLDRREEHLSTLIVLEFPDLERDRLELPPEQFDTALARLGHLLHDKAAPMPAARLGGAHFAVLAVAMAGAVARDFATELARFLAQPIALPGQTRAYHARIGLVQILPGSEGDSLIARAEAAAAASPVQVDEVRR